MGKPMSPGRRRRLWQSYGLDWLLTIIVWAVFYALDKVNGYRRLFSITDTSLLHPYAEHERIPVWALALIAGIFPLIVILVWAGAGRKSWFDAQVGALGLGLSLGLTSTFTNIVKITVGRPRPDIVARCVPPLDYTSNPLFGLTSWTICTRTDELQEGFRSFPSGHSSFGWAGMWYLALFAAGKMRIWDRRGYTLKSWLLLIPVSAAALISISRTMDYRHHATDVIAGGIIGILVAWYCYRQYYPALTDPCAHRPYPPRIPRDDEDGPGRDIEHGGVPDTDVYRPEDQVGGRFEGYNNRVSMTDSRTPLVHSQGSTRQAGLPQPPIESYASPAHHQHPQQYRSYAQPGLADQAGGRLRTRTEDTVTEQVPLDGLKGGRRSGEEGVILQPGQSRRGDEAFL
ncbi:hypothetical protein FFLO_00965 [Filobasidium floriforme]|uniref:Phosphatidic acid phosphatase type 2/haloperoxidase domain-containing protein n=1 Tax=Filobasidium floriforme TaxID=5210 RepID=A0A8K0JQL4_9TREE|nr:hypothetical protein FFLO_00965 [Filobasidium floriforme]